MATEAERIRQEIASTRAELARDVERLGHRTSTGRPAGRVVSLLRRIKDRTMGTSERAASTVADAASDVTDRLHEAGGEVADRLHRASQSAVDTLHDVGHSVQDAARKVTRPDQGSPVGVGLIALGGGMLAAALIPETDAERRAAHQLSQRAAPIVEPLLEAGRALAGDVRDTVGAAGEHVRTAAVEAASHVQSAAADGAEEVRMAASGGIADVRGAAQTGVDKALTAAGDTRDAVSGSAMDATREASERATAALHQVRRDT
jgi:hypothetical protein